MDKKLSISQYIELTNNTYNGVYNKCVHQISVVENINPNDLHYLSQQELIDRYNKVKWVNSPLIKTDTDTIKLEDIELKLFDFNKITFGQFVDLEVYISNNYLENLHKIISCLYLSYNKEPFKEIQYEDYSKIDVEERSKYILDNVYINDVANNLDKYLQFRSNIFDTFSNVFSSTNDDVDIDELSEEALKIYKEEKEKQEKNKDKIWFDILDIVAENVSNYDKVFETNIFLIFSKLSKIKNENIKSNKTK